MHSSAYVLPMRWNELPTARDLVHWHYFTDNVRQAAGELPVKPKGCTAEALPSAMLRNWWYCGWIQLRPDFLVALQLFTTSPRTKLKRRTLLKLSLHSTGCTWTIIRQMEHWKEMSHSTMHWRQICLRHLLTMHCGWTGWTTQAELNCTLLCGIMTVKQMQIRHDDVMTDCTERCLYCTDDSWTCQCGDFWVAKSLLMELGWLSLAFNETEYMTLWSFLIWWNTAMLTDTLKCWKQVHWRCHFDSTFAHCTTYCISLLDADCRLVLHVRCKFSFVTACFVQNLALIHCTCIGHHIIAHTTDIVKTGCLAPVTGKDDASTEGLTE